MSHSIIRTIDSLPPSTANRYATSFTATQVLENYNSILARKLENRILLSTDDPADPSKPEILFRKPIITERRRADNNLLDKRRHTFTTNQFVEKPAKITKPKQYKSPRPQKRSQKFTKQEKPISAPITKRESPREKKVSQLIMEFNQIDPKIPFSRNRYVGQYNEIITQVQQRNQTLVRKKKEERFVEKCKGAELMKKRKEEGYKISMQNREKYLQKQRVNQNAEQGVEINIDEEKIAENKVLIDKMRDNQKSIYSPINSPHMNSVHGRKKRCLSEVKAFEIKRRKITPEEKFRRESLVKRQQVNWHQSIIAEKKEKIKRNYKKIKNLQILSDQIKGINIKLKKKSPNKKKSQKKKQFPRQNSGTIPQDLIIDLIRPHTTKASIQSQRAHNENEENREYSKSLVSPIINSSPEKLLQAQHASFFNKANELRSQQHKRNIAIPFSNTVIKNSIPLQNNSRPRNSVSLYEKQNEQSKNLYRMQIKDKLIEFAKRLDLHALKLSTCNEHSVLTIQRCMRGILARKVYQKLKHTYYSQINTLDIDALEMTMPKPFTSKERMVLAKKKIEIEQERDTQLKLLQSNKDELSALVDISRKCLDSFQIFAQTLISQRSPEEPMHSINKDLTNSTPEEVITSDYQRKVCELATLLAEHKITPEEHMNQLESLHNNWKNGMEKNKKPKSFNEIKSPKEIINEIKAEELKKEEDEAQQMLANAMDIDVYKEIKKKTHFNKDFMETSHSIQIQDVIGKTTIQSINSQNEKPGSPIIKIIDDSSLISNLTRPRAENSLDEKAAQIANYICDVLLNELKTSMFPIRKNSSFLRGFPTDIEYVEKYINEIYDIIRQNMPTFLANIITPINRSSLYILGQLQNQDPTYFKDIDNIMSQPVLPIEWYIDIEKNRKDKTPENNQSFTEEQQLSEMINIHNKCIYDALNDALDYFKPLGVKGPPLPWSTKTRDLGSKKAQVEAIFAGAKEKVIQWCRVNAGCIMPANLLISTPEQLRLAESGLAVNYLNSIREERLVYILTGEINENEESWVDYEIEETQVKFDLADMILDSLLSETTEILVSIEENRCLKC